jgi:hypothetical protein
VIEFDREEEDLRLLLLCFLLRFLSFFLRQNEVFEVSGMATMQEEEVLIRKLYRERNSILEK